jgi:hypothetical protein
LQKVFSLERRKTTFKNISSNRQWEAVKAATVSTVNIPTDQNRNQIRNQKPKQNPSLKPRQNARKGIYRQTTLTKLVENHFKIAISNRKEVLSGNR